MTRWAGTDIDYHPGGIPWRGGDIPGTASGVMYTVGYGNSANPADDTMDLDCQQQQQQQTTDFTDFTGQAERLKEMLKQKYSRQKEETDEMEKRRKKLEEQMTEVKTPLKILLNINH